ncbi:MAG: PfkB family carbohydrate kinase [Actinomycetota bacterium]|nr:PfkB family carbohydrate kinase [Actinomycetota bacterium]
MTGPAAPGHRTLVLGEALIDIVRRNDGSSSEHVGGSPLNVALGLAALDETVDFATRYGDDERGHRIAQTLSEGGVHPLGGSAGADRTSTAVAVLDEHAGATYVFDLVWDLPPTPVSVQTAHLHTGSIAAVLEPGGSEVVAALEAAREWATISYDPNVRLHIMTDLDAARARIEQIIALSDVVKASEEDVAVLYPGHAVPDVLRAWGALGARLVVVTRGGDGVVASVTSTGEVASEPTRATHVEDTVGAGDSFMAGLISGLLEHGLLGGPEGRTRLATASLDDVRPALERGLATSGVTVGRAGAYAPSRPEL